MQLLDDFQPGDLLYGETRDREKYLSKLDGKFAPSGAEPGFFPKAPVTIDRVTSLYVVEKSLKQGKPPSDIDGYADLPLDTQRFYEFAQKSRFQAKLTGKGTTDQTKGGIRKGADLTKPFLRSKCKAGIEFVVQRGFTVRFVLDSLDKDALKRIFHKEFEQPWYTGAELRSIYKHRDKYGNHVVFYRSGSRCDAPWVQYPDVIPKT